MQNNKILIIIFCVDSYWVWRSLVARLNGVQEAGSSNLLTQTTFEETDTFVSVFLLCRVRRPFELRDAAALPCYSVALLLTNLLTQTTRKSDEYWVTGSSDFYFITQKSPLTQILTQIIFE